MTVIPYYNLIVLPGVTFYFQGEYFREIAGEDLAVGSEVVFMMSGEEKKREDLTADDLYPIGVRGEVVSVGNEGEFGITSVARVDIINLTVEAGMFTFELQDRPEKGEISAEELQTRLNNLRSAYSHYFESTQWGVLAKNYMMQWKTMAEMTCMLSSRLSITNAEKYAILSEDDVVKRTEMMETALYELLEMMKVTSEAENEQARKSEKLYREEAIRKQIEYLQRELEEMHPENISDVRRLEKLVDESGMNETALREAKRVLTRMRQEGEHSPEYGMLYDYLDFVTGLSWKCEEAHEIDMKRAAQILDEDHYGMRKVKNRILQQIAVMNLNQKQSGSILLFVGAPGTGKTSIGQSIAKALDRKYVRVSLGGVRDEADIRGHRRTYIGAMAGRIMDGIRRSGVSNPVMVLDEVDKLSRDYGKDPGSALLEVLDPEQNNTFTDHYMNVPYDLSNVFFICTANTEDTISEPLRNRMEIIPFSGYTMTDKLQIARRHLLPAAMKAAGIKGRNLRISDDTLRSIISDYTAESGVRGLKKRLDTLCRVAAVKLVEGEAKTVTVTAKRLREYLDDHPIRHDHLLEEREPGVVTGLAWTSAGGEILFMETTFTKGDGKVVITGQLGDVMKESVQIAISLVKKFYPDRAELFRENDLHIHVPAGAVPKDGPSAGITLTTALASLVSGRSVDPAIAMTGEVSLRGVVMPIGGLPEKLMAAVRAGIKKVYIPKDNVDDLDEVPEEVRSALEILPVSRVEEVLRKTGIMQDGPDAEDQKRQAAGE